MFSHLFHNMQNLNFYTFSPEFPVLKGLILIRLTITTARLNNEMCIFLFIYSHFPSGPVQCTCSREHDEVHSDLSQIMGHCLLSGLFQGSGALLVRL